MQGYYLSKNLNTLTFVNLITVTGRNYKDSTVLQAVIKANKNVNQIFRSGDLTAREVAAASQTYTEPKNYSINSLQMRCPKSLIPFSIHNGAKPTLLALSHKENNTEGSK